MNNYVNYSLVNQSVLETFKICDINALPINLDQVKRILCKKYNCRFVSFSTHMGRNNLSLNEMYEFAGSHDACCIYNASQKKYLIFYNDVDYNLAITRRFRWNIAHEIGHMILRHNEKSSKSRICRNTLSDKEYNILEEEAENFATLFLAHPALLEKLEVTTYTDISKICDISLSAAKSVFKYIKIRTNFTSNKKYDSRIVDHFYNFINVKKCVHCGRNFITKHTTYCIYCGEKRLTRGDLKMIYTKGIEINDNGTCVQCPTCGNEEIDSSTYYCKICGTFIIQKCIGDQYNLTYPFVNLKDEDLGCNYKNIPSNARYCPHCGGATSFKFLGILTDWDKEQQKLQATENTSPHNISNDDDFPF